MAALMRNSDDWPTRLFTIIICLTTMCSGNLNVYLNQHEVMRLLGLSAELFYVREGLVNEYALHFTVPVPATMDNLAFTWQSLAGRPLPYTLSVEVSNLVALPHPAFNISTVGSVPTSPHTFAVALACSGAVTAEVNVTISVNVTLNRATNNVTELLFRRKKICLKDDGGTQARASRLPASTASSTVLVDSLPPQDPSAGFMYIALGGAVALGAVCAVFGGAYCARGGPKSPPRVPGQGGSALLDIELDNKQAEAYASYSHRDEAHSSTGGSIFADGDIRTRERDLQERILELTIQRCRVRLRSVVLEGTFGRVYRGTYAEEGLLSGPLVSTLAGSALGGEIQEVEVMVKTVAEQASQTQVSLLLHEGMSLYGLQHPHLLTVLGVSIEDHTAPFIIYKQSNHCNLKKTLQASRPHSPSLLTSDFAGISPPRALTTSDLVLMGLQLSQALTFLHSKGLVHRDVAARNCVIDDNLHVKLTDNALSRDLFPGDYHCLGDNENRPVKWLSLEALLRRAFGGPADVWSFGVLLWELATLAQQPYAEVDPFEVAAYLSDGYRLAQPINCPDELFSVMAYCWALNPDERPSFAQLQICLREFYTQLTQYV